MNVSINILFVAHPRRNVPHATFGPKIFQAIFSPATYRPDFYFGYQACFKLMSAQYSANPFLYFGLLGFKSDESILI